MKRFLKAALIGLGTILCVIPVFLSFFGNFNSGLLITFLLGLVLLLYGIYLEKINYFTQKGPLKWLRYIAYSLFALTGGLLLFIAVYGKFDTITYEEDVIIVLGGAIKGETVLSPLAYRLDAAAAYYNKNPGTVFVVSGGRGPQEDIAEALAMERYLVRKGVPQEKIIKEDQATSTYENFVYSKKILDDYFKKPYTAGFITNTFHVYRAKSLARLAGLNPTHQHARLDWYSVPVNYLRECAAIIKLWIFKN